MSTSMSGMDMSSTTTSAAAATSTAMPHGSMGGNGCKISMLWNWNTIDSCFLASSWHITSAGMFAGSCIGVILLVIALEFLRRVGKEYDQFLVRGHQKKLQGVVSVCPPRDVGPEGGSDGAKATSTCEGPNHDSIKAVSTAQNMSASARFRPNVFQQAIRALLHMVQFAVAYFIMLLAMYYNGYIIICIFIGAFIGSFIFNWTELGSGGFDNDPSHVTYCCG